MNEENKNENIEQTPTQEVPQEVPVQEIPQEEIPSTLQSDAPEKSTSGPLIGIAIIIIVLIAGGIYFWSTAVDRGGEAELPTIQSEEAVDEIVSQLNTQGTSDEIADIEADLDTTELDNLDSELDALLNEL